MSVPQTLATWTVIETIVSILGLLGVLLLALVLRGVKEPEPVEPRPDGRTARIYPVRTRQTHADS